MQAEYAVRGYVIRFDDEQWSRNMWNNIQIQGISCRYNVGGRRVHDEPKRKGGERNERMFKQKVW